MAIQPVGSHSSDFTTVGTIPLGSQYTAEMLFPHELHHQLVVGRVPQVPKRQGDPPIPVASFMLCADLADLHPFRTVFLGIGRVLNMIIIGASGKVGYWKKHSQRIVLP